MALLSSQQPFAQLAKQRRRVGRCRRLPRQSRVCLCALLLMPCLTLAKRCLLVRRALPLTLTILVRWWTHCGRHVALNVLEKRRDVERPSRRPLWLTNLLQLLWHSLVLMLFLLVVRPAPTLVLGESLRSSPPLHLVRLQSLSHHRRLLAKVLGILSSLSLALLALSEVCFLMQRQDLLTCVGITLVLSKTVWKRIFQPMSVPLMCLPGKGARDRVRHLQVVPLDSLLLAQSQRLGGTSLLPLSKPMYVGHQLHLAVKWFGGLCWRCYSWHSYRCSSFSRILCMGTADSVIKDNSPTDDFLDIPGRSSCYLTSGAQISSSAASTSPEKFGDFDDFNPVDSSTDHCADAAEHAL